MISSESDNLKSNYYNIDSLIKQKTTEELRLFFKYIWMQKIGKEWKDSINDGNEFINGIGKPAYEKSFYDQKNKFKS